MKTLSIDYTGSTKKLHNLAKKFDFSISNPDAEYGTSFDFVIKGKLKIAGWDLFMQGQVEQDIKINESQIQIVEDWLNDNTKTSR